MMFRTLVAVALVTLTCLVTGGQSNDERCSCKCPEVYWVDPTIITSWPERKIYINSTVKAETCDCENVVKPVLNLTPNQVDKMCPRCKCKHEERSTTTIKVVVIIILWILTILIVYLLYLVCLDPLIKGKPIQVRGAGTSHLPYQSYSNEEGSLDNESMADGTPMRAVRSGGVVNRLGAEQDRWKKAVENQRNSVYNRHSMLN